MSYPNWLLPLVWLVTAAIMIWQNKSRMSLVLAGIMIGWASWILMDAFMPFFMQQVSWAFQWFNVVGLTGFMLIVGSFTAVLLWVFDRW